MANPDRAKGFTPSKMLNGSPYNGLVRRLAVATGDSIFIGTPIKLSSGKAVPMTTGNGSESVIGVALAFGKDINEHDGPGPFNPQKLEDRHYSATTETDWFVWYAPADSVIFEVQTASDLDLVVGSGAKVGTAVDAGSTSTGVSTAEITATATGTAVDVIVVEDPAYPDNDTTIANARHLVVFKNVPFHQTSPSVV